MPEVLEALGLEEPPGSYWVGADRVVIELQSRM